MEFAVDAGFSELIIEGDSINVMRALSSPNPDLSVCGNVVADIQCLTRGIRRCLSVGLKGIVIGQLMF